MVCNFYRYETLILIYLNRSKYKATIVDFCLNICGLGTEPGVSVPFCFLVGFAICTRVLTNSNAEQFITYGLFDIRKIDEVLYIIKAIINLCNLKKAVRSPEQKYMSL